MRIKQRENIIFLFSSFLLLSLLFISSCCCSGPSTLFGWCKLAETRAGAVLTGTLRDVAAGVPRNRDGPPPQAARTSATLVVLRGPVPDLDVWTIRVLRVSFSDKEERKRKKERKKEKEGWCVFGMHCLTCFTPLA